MINLHIGFGTYKDYHSINKLLKHKVFIINYNNYVNLTFFDMREIVIGHFVSSGKAA